MAGKGGRPKGTTGESDRRLLEAFLEKRTLRFREAVDVTGLARGTASSSLRRFARNHFIVRSQGKRPIYTLTDQRGAWAYVLTKNLSEIRRRLKELERMRKRVGKSVRHMVRKIDHLGFKDQDTPATLRRFEEWAWSKVPPGMAYEDYWHYHPPSVSALIYALKKHPRLFKEQLVRSEQGDLGSMLQKLRLIEELESTIRREKQKIGLKS
jgi:hypothetical protein